jgi:TorA maturation chaperone TorD
MTGTTVAPLLADLFRFLGRSLEYPREEWLDRDYLQGLVTLLAELGWEDELSELRNLPAAPAALRETLQIEYTRLFINAVPAAVALPYGSVHWRGEGMLNSRSTGKTRGFYRRHGFDLAAAGGLADYLPLELEFLARLVESEREGEAEEFLAELFRPWFGPFRDRVLGGAPLPFYRIIIELIDFFTKEEDEYGN